MRCHYCDREGDVAVECEGVTVFVCASHFRERLAELAESDWPADLRDQLEP